MKDDHNNDEDNEAKDDPQDHFPLAKDFLDEARLKDIKVVLKMSFAKGSPTKILSHWKLKFGPFKMTPC